MGVQCKTACWFAQIDPFLYKTNTGPAGLSKLDERRTKVHFLQSSTVGTRPTVRAGVAVNGNARYPQTQNALTNVILVKSAKANFERAILYCHHEKKRGNLTMAMATPRTPMLMIVKHVFRQFLKYWPWFMWNQKMAGRPTVRYRLAPMPNSEWDLKSYS